MDKPLKDYTLGEMFDYCPVKGMDATPEADALCMACQFGRVCCLSPEEG